MRNGWQIVHVSLGLGLLAVLIFHVETVGQAVSVWNRSATYSLGWIVLPTLGYLNRRRIAARQPVGSVAGVALAVLFSVAWLTADLMNVAEGRQLALVASLCAVVVAALGWRVFVVLMPFLALLVFLVPTGGFLLTPLKYITVSFIAALGAIPGLPIETNGFAVFVDSQRYVVIDDCAGLPYLLLGLFLGLTLALLNFRTWWKICLFVLLSGVLAIVANGLRVVSIVLYDYMTGSELDFTGHAYIGWVANGLGLLTLFMVFSRLAPEQQGKYSWSAHPAPSAGQTARAVWLLMLALVPVASVPMVADAVSVGPVPYADVGLPTKLGGWARQTGISDWRPASRGKATVDILATYGRQDMNAAIFLVQATSPDGKVSGAAIDLVGDHRWLRSRQQPRTVCIENGCWDVNHLTLVLRDSERVRHIYTLYAVGADTTLSPLMLRMQRAWAHVRGEPQSARMIAIASDTEAGLSDSELGEMLQQLLVLTTPTDSDDT